MKPGLAYNKNVCKHITLFLGLHGQTAFLCMHGDGKRDWNSSQVLLTSYKFGIEMETKNGNEMKYVIK